MPLAPSATFTARGALPFIVGRHRPLLPRAHERALPWAGQGRDAARAPRRDRRVGAAWASLHRMLAPRRSGVGQTHRATRSEADGAGARGLLPDRAAADLALRRHAVAHPGCRRAGASHSGFRRTRPPSGWRGASISSSRAVLVRRGPVAPRLAASRRLRGRSAVSCTVRCWSTCDGVRDEAATRALIAQENRRYARRQLIWFRKEPNLVWLDGPGESPETLAAANDLLARAIPLHQSHRHRA